MTFLGVPQNINIIYIKCCNINLTLQDLSLETFSVFSLYFIFLKKSSLKKNVQKLEVLLESSRPIHLLNKNLIFNVLTFLQFQFLT